MDLPGFEEVGRLLRGDGAKTHRLIRVQVGKHGGGDIAFKAGHFACVVHGGKGARRGDAHDDLAEVGKGGRPGRGLAAGAQKDDSAHDEQDCRQAEQDAAQRQRSF